MIQNIKISKDFSIKKSMKLLNKTEKKCLIVIDNNNKLLGTLSDGDLRKGILKGSAINDSINNLYNTKPNVIIKKKYTLQLAKKIFLKNKFDLIPIVDSKNFLVDIVLWEDVFDKKLVKIKKQVDAEVVIMAGGKGTRLEPFTKVLPKPLIPINDKPVIQHIIESFTINGIKKFYLSLNYKGYILKAFFKELKPSYEFEFIEEKKPLGTAGSLFYLKNNISKPFFVTNCDVIINIDYKSLYNFHINNKFDITLVASAKEYTIPYGTCILNKHGHLSSIKEKPSYDFLINSGLYVISPSVLELIKEGVFYHITDLISDAMKNKMKVGVFPIDDDEWVDIGQWAEYKKAIEKLN